MTPALRKIVSFVLLFFPIFAVLVGVYAVAIPYYQSAILWMSNAVTEVLSPPSRIEAKAEGGWNAYTRNQYGELQHLKSWVYWVPHLVYLSLAVLPALILATPASLADRLRMLTWALLLLPVIHMLSLIGLVRGTMCMFNNPGNCPGTFRTCACLILLRLVYTSGQVFAAVLWVLLTWRYWFAKPEARPSG